MKGKTMDTEQSGLTIERGARLTFVDREKGRNIDGLFIGTVDKGDLVVAPLSDHQPQLSAGAILNGRFLSREDMVAFTSEILEVFDHPVSLWRIQAPTDVKTLDLRDNKRIQCSVSASIEAIDRGQVLAGIIQDISKSGARCSFPSTDAAESPFFVGETVILRCVFPGMPGEQTTRGEITDVHHSKVEWSMALRFAEPAWWVPPYH
jgi:hypothetical protein